MLAKKNGVDTNNPNSLVLGAFSNKAQSFLYESDAFINIAHGSVRSGKTIVATFRFLLFVLESDYYEFMISGKTRDTIERNVVRDLIRMIEGRIPYKYRKFDNYIEILDKKIWLIGFSDEGATEKVRGMTIGGWYADELTSASKSTVEMAITRCSVDGAQMFWTMNPDSPYHYIYTDYITNTELLKSGTVKVWHFTLEDNLHLSPRYIEELKRVNRRSEVNYKRNILGEWVIAEGVIYDTFDTQENVYHGEHPRVDEVNISSDYGVSHATVFCAIGVQYNETGNRYYLLEETYHSGEETGVSQTDSERVEDILYLQEKYHPRTLFLSHDASSLMAECQKDSRIKMAIEKYSPNVYEDINTIQNLFNQNRFLIHESCRNSIKQAQVYAWDSKAQRQGIEKPLKVNDDCCDAWRGGICGLMKRKNILGTIIEI